MNNLEEQYNEQFKEIKRRYRKQKMNKMIVSAVLGIVCALITMAADKGIIIEQNEAIKYMFLIFAIGFAVITIRLPFHQTHNEYVELRDLNSAYTHERLRQRKG